MPRGIVNPTGTACHLSSAILLTYYCLEPLAQSLTWDNHDDVSFYLASVWTQLEDNQVNIDPTLLYRAIQKTLHVQAHDLGDAVTSWCRVMQHCRSWCRAWDETVGGGQVHSVLRGYQDYNQQKEAPNFTKSLPIRPMPVPYSIVLDDNNVDCSTLVQALENSLQPRVVQGGYQWRSPQQQQPATTKTDEDCTTQTITTSKTLYWDSLPKYWMIHLDRRRQQRSDATCDIPLFLDPTDITFCSVPSASYELQGAILHVTTIDNQEEEDGHYLTLIREPSRQHCHDNTNDNDENTNDTNDQWYCLDDDLVRTVSSTALALQLCTGCPMPVEWNDDQDDDKLWVCGFLLVYRSNNNNVDNSIDNTFVRANDTDNNNDKHTNTVDWTRPYTLVGRKLKVLWSKGQWYSGVVASYHPTTGQHEIHYTDGDVKRYQLRKKTIEWLE